MLTRVWASPPEEIQRFCQIYFSQHEDQRFCQNNALDSLSVAACGRRLEARAHRLYCIEKKTPYDLTNTCDRYLVEEQHIFKCLKHITNTNVIHKCAKENNFRPAKIHLCLNFSSLSIENSEFDFEFSTGANIKCNTREGKGVEIKSIILKRGEDGRLMARYKTNSGFFLFPNPSSKWFVIPNEVFFGTNRNFAWKLASSSPLSEEESSRLLNRYLLPTIRTDNAADTIFSCAESTSDESNPSTNSAIRDSNRHSSPSTGATNPDITEEESSNGLTR